jgi:diketogulonate reductase-like aldo/keto reductase
MTQPYITLNDGNKIPQMGYGVFLISKDDDAEKCVLEALKVGYRHIDTAHAYFNERGVGRAMKKSGVPRKDIFLTSKLWITEYGEEASYAAIDKMLKRLDTDYIDLLLLHQPFNDYVGAYKAMEKAQKEGKVKSIGISNFYGEQLDDILTKCTVKPAVNQVECHPYFDQRDLIKKLEPYGTKIEAWYPLGHGDKALLGEAVFTKLAKKYNKTNSQIILRWHIQKGIIVFPKTINHLKENFEIFDFELTKEEMGEISKIHKNKVYYDMSNREENYKKLAAYNPTD